MNQKQAKRIRRNIRLAMEAQTGIRNAIDTDTTYQRGLVDSQRFNTTVNGELHESSAIKIIVEPTSFRGIYHRVKNRVQAARGQKRKRVLSGVQLRLEETAGAMEHTGAESLQRVHRDVPVL